MSKTSKDSLQEKKPGCASEMDIVFIHPDPNLLKVFLRASVQASNCQDPKYVAI